MNQLQLFKYQDKEVRTVTLNGEPWFVAKDVCEALNLSNPSETIKALDADEKSTLRISEGGPEANIVTEAGLYTLIIRSNKSEAKAFKRWVTHEVLPTIRKTGGYVANDDLFIATYLPRADEATKLLFKTTLHTVRTLSEQNAIMAPKAEYFDALVARNLLTNLSNTAKELKMKPKAFIGFLFDEKYIFRNNKGEILPYEAKNRGLFEVKEYVNGKWTGIQTLITPKGRETFRLLVKGAKA